MNKPVAILAFTFLCIQSPIYAQWEAHVIDDNMNWAVSVDAVDVDGDTKPDLVVTNYRDNELLLYMNNYPDEWPRHVCDSNIGVTFAWTGDIDGDDTLDIVASLYRQKRMVWYKNNRPAWPRIMIDYNTDDADFMLVADINGDDKLDVITAPNAFGRVLWYENPNWTERTIDPGTSGPVTLNITDIDGDGRLDVVATMPLKNQVVWYRNEYNGLSWEKIIIDSSLINAWAINSGDIDGDDRVDIVVTTGGAYHDGSKVVWYRNEYNGLSWEGPFIIDSLLPGGHWVDISDLDGDDALDVIAVGYDEKVVVWYENNHPTWNKYIIGTNIYGPRVFAVVDVDGDNKKDVIVPGTRSLVLYKNNLTTAIHEPSVEIVSTIKIYPNPTSNILNIEISDNGKQTLEIEIFDVTGKAIYRQEYKNYNTHFVKQFDISRYAKGLYLVKIKQAKTVFSRKVIVI